MNHPRPQPFQIKRDRPRSWLAKVLSTTFVIIGAFAIAILLNLFVFQSYYVDGESMSPTLHTDNRLIVSKVERSYAKLQAKSYIPKRGQIVVISGAASPDTASRAPELIKRVIGIPGDYLTIKNGVVTVTTSTTAAFDVDKSLGLDLDPTYSQYEVSITIPDGKVYVMGDNRKQGGSLDSRVFGLVDADLIDGWLWARIMPFDQGRVF